ncbi:MAG: filamentous hemagglutinin N-terminal domain-containing protein, partial [Thiotrichaceae bacterium]|nr:filamentous hemagglutinin N-terminal domain-containing protein [Thiotrichaceae bacterium]
MSKLIFLLLSLIPTILLAEITTDGTLGEKLQLNAPDYQVSADLGQQVNNTLFHSFETFNLNAGETATFFGSEQLEYILSRVTGEQASFLNGALRTSGVDDIEFYFMNPNGIIFGQHAQLDINGSVFFSTADTLYLAEEFGDGTGEFSATHPENTLLTVAEPFAFGFLDNDIAPLTINGSQLQVDGGNLLGIAAGDIHVTAGANIFTLGIPETDVVKDDDDFSLSSGIALVSIGSSGFLDLTGNSEGLLINDESDPASPIPVFKTEQNPRKVLIDFDGEEWGDITIDENSHLIADSEGNSASLVYLQAEKIIFDNQSSIHANAYGDQTINGLGNYIWLFADELTLDNQSQIIGQKISGTGFGSGVLGFVDESITLRNNSSMSVDTTGKGNAGSIVLFTRNLTMDNSLMSTQSKGLGNGGSIWIQATESINFTGDEENIIEKINDLFRFAADIQAEGEQQLFLDELDSLTRLDATKLRADSINGGNAGAIFLLTDKLTANTFLLTSETVRGNAGGVFIQANNAEIKDFIFSSSVLTEGNGGIVFVDIEDSLKAEGGLFISAARGNASAGGVYIESDILYFNKTNISTTALRGGGGNVVLNVDNIALFSTSQVLASAEESNGDGGDVSIEYPVYLVSNHGLILAQARGGRGGNISIKALNLIASNDTRVSASSEQGIDGIINIQAPDVNFNEASLVFTPKFAVLNTNVRDMCKVRIADQLPTEFQLDYSFIVLPFSGQYSSLEDWQPSYTRQEFSL